MIPVRRGAIFYAARPCCKIVLGDGLTHFQSEEQVMAHDIAEFLDGCVDT